MPSPRLFAAASIAALLCACGGPEGAAQPAADRAQAAPPVETRPPNAEGQTPAFPAQTRAPEVQANVAYETTVVAEGLDHPWAIAFLPDGRMLVTERAGRLRIVGADGTLSAPVAGLPAVDAQGQGGLLGLALDPDFDENRLVYWSYADRDAEGTRTSVARGRLEPGAPPRLEDVQVIFRQAPAMESTMHYGGRLVFAPDGTLFVTLGERSILPGRMQAQRLDSDLGKVVRIKADGSIPGDNPFVGREGARPEIWSIGHRNIQAAAINPLTGKLWEVEHGARGGDELNIPEAGKDYGWPTISYGQEYSGKPIGEGITAKEGMEQPVYYWDPVIAPSGMAFYQADLFPKWKGSLFVGALAGRHVARLTLDGDEVVGEERILTELKQRIRDVAVGPDGALYVATDSAEGQVIKLTPKG
ncbi:MAG: PQQ-dependent sugar dehydrogenase [Phenylobacterium sp.]|uniref:PQQ-dependent sugar dehydrogenase n=1 Tax=Phenylobacterium sp. TaxID=1871053 RepID=UPI003919670D